MKKRARKKLPIVRLVLVMLLAGGLFSAGFYAYHKRNAAPGQTWVATMGDMLSQVKKLNEGLKVTKKAVLVDEPPQEQVKFEFYNSLADTQVKVSDAPVQVASIKTPISRPSTQIVSADELEKEFYNQIKVKK